MRLFIVAAAAAVTAMAACSATTSPHLLPTPPAPVGGCCQWNWCSPHLGKLQRIAEQERWKPRVARPGV